VQPVGDGVSSSGPDPVPGIDATRPEFVTPEQLWAGKPVGERSRSSTPMVTHGGEPG
jgi:hypothetical protein